jgi:5-methylcytosine-specific restriction endonuclease McrA
MRRGIYKPGEIVHHIIEIDPVTIEKPEISLSFDNLELLCRECHAEAHNERNKGRRYLFGENGEIILK